MIVIQSFIAVGDIHQVESLQANHQINHQLSHQSNNSNRHQHIIMLSEQSENHQYSSNIVIEDTSVNTDASHVECHHGHCHHSSVLFIVKLHQSDVALKQEQKIWNKNIHINSILLTLDLRPPISIIS